MKQHVWKIVTAVFLFAFAFVMVWMNRFQYEHAWTTQTLVRINRFTGQQCLLTADKGWISKAAVAQSDDKWKQYEGFSLSGASVDSACQ